MGKCLFCWHAPAVGRLEEYIKSSSAATPMLPLSHVTKVAYARDIFESGSIKAVFCPVLTEELIYFFYGRAEYRWFEQEASDLPGEKPVCFIVHNIDDGDIYSTFPFDTGAYGIENGIRQKFFPHIEDVLELSIGADITSAQQLITAFYGDNDAYKTNDPKLLNVDEFYELEVAAYLQLVSRSGKAFLDGRRATPEIVAHNRISLRDVSYVIAPLQAQSSSTFMATCLSYSITPVFYDINTPLRPSEYISVIQQKFNELL